MAATLIDGKAIALRVRQEVASVLSLVLS